MKRSLILAALAFGLLTAGVATAEIPGSAQEIQPALIGAEAPEVEVRKLDGKAVSFAEFAGEQPTVLIFYRGGW